MLYINQNNRNSKKTQVGLTLVELLIVVSITAVIALAIYGILNNGLKIYSKVNQRIAAEDVEVFFAKLGMDLRNSFNFSTINFSGKDDILEFATLVRSPRLKKRSVGKVIYRYDPLKKILSREEKDFSQIYNAEEGRVTQIFPGVRAAKFQFYSFDKDKQECLWSQEWSKTTMPLAVRLEIELNDGQTRENFVKTVSLPLAS
jgi:prepilin-type N-terminal cleavage/methylation domain-containing protein